MRVHVATFLLKTKKANPAVSRDSFGFLEEGQWFNFTKGKMLHLFFF